MKWTARIDGEKVIIEGNAGEGSGAILEIQDTGFIYLFEIPQYGGFPRSDGVYRSVHEAMKIAESWT